MKCFNCEIPISPAFSKAIMDNQCPACGKNILKDDDFRELIRVRGLLQDLELEEGVVVSVAAAISQKYDLVPRGTRKATSRLPTEEEIEAIEGLSEEEKMRLRALQAAQENRRMKEEEALIQEWGLDHGQLGSGVDGSGERHLDPDMVALFQNAGASSDLDEPMPSLAPANKNQDRLARAEALKHDLGKFKVMRSE